MRVSKQLREAILILLGVALAAGSANAQPMVITHWTIEARIAQVDHVVVGTIDKVARKVIVAPGERTKTGFIDSNGQAEYTLTVKIGEVLKGNLQGNVDDLRIAHSLGFDKRYEEWSKAQTSLLWFLGRAPKAGERRLWDILPLGKRVAAEDIFGGRRESPTFSMDFTVLKDENEILARARAFARTSKALLPIHPIHIPAVVSRNRGQWDYLMVPVEPTLEERAKRLIASPQVFVPKGEKLDPLGRYLLRFGGVNSLRYFKSDANATLLRSLLDDPLEVFESSIVGQYPVRTKAFEVLLHWGVDVPLPKSAHEITSLDLAGTNVTDHGLKQVAELKNLQTLDVQETKVTDKGLKELAGLKKLTLLRLSEGQMSDANLRVLREIGLLHTVSKASAGSGQQPKSIAQQATLWHAFRNELDSVDPLSTGCGGFVLF